MKGIRRFAGPLLLGLLVAGAFPASPRTSRSRDPEGPDASLVLKPAEHAPRDVVSRPAEGFSGGPAGTLLVGAALAAAVTLILAAVIPWWRPLEGRTR